MTSYVTGATIKHLRERRGMTQAQLAQKLNVSSKAISKWETGRGYPDITLLEGLAGELSISVIELLSGESIVNQNVSCNMLKTALYVCPVCGNVVCSSGNAMISCCGITLPPLEEDEPDAAHAIRLEPVEDEIHVTVTHDMEKDHYISFLACVKSDKVELVKLYPEGPAQAHFRLYGGGLLYWYCNRHGLMRQKA